MARGILIAVVAFAGGMGARALIAPDHSPAVTLENGEGGDRAAATKVSRRESGPNGAERSKTASGAASSAAARAVIRIGPAAERLRRFLALLDGVDAGNWEQLARIMTEETSENGRFQGQEWDLMMRRIGAVDGQRAADVYAGKGEEDSLRKILAGWTQTDPEAAWKWLEGYKDERGRRDMWRGPLIGIAEVDPALAMRKLDSLPDEVKGGTISFLVAPMVQAEGIDATTDRIREIYKNYMAKDPATISAKEREYVYAFFHNVCDIKRNAGYTPEKRMEALETLAGFPNLARSSPWLIERTVAAAARDNPEQAMQLVETMTVENGRVLDPRGVESACKVWREKDPAGLAEWIEKNRGTPLGILAAGMEAGGGG